MITENEKKNWKSARACLGPTGRLSVIMPVFRLEETIRSNIERVSSFLRGAIPFEIVPVDDGSDDRTADAIRLAAAADPEHVHPVYIELNGGKGNALARGFAASTGSHVLLLDGDLDLSPERVTVFFDVMAAKRAAIVIGSKRHPQSEIDYPWHRRLASGVYYSIVRILTGLPVTDTQTGMKLFTREALGYSLQRMLVKTFAFDLELLSIAYNHGYRVAEAPIEMHFGNKMGCLNLRNVTQVMHDTLAIFYRERILHYYQSVEVAPPIAKPFTVSVVIACPAPSDYLIESLEALAAQTYRQFEVIILPDAPADAVLRRHDPFPVRVIPTGKVRPAEKRNLGIREAKGEIVAFLDDDAYPSPVWLEKAVPYFAFPDVGGVGGPGVTPPDDPFLARAGGRVYQNRFVSGNYRYRYLGDRVRRAVDDYPSCNLLVRTDILRTIGGYNTRYWPGEDTILCSDIVFGQKKRIVYDPWALVYHHRRALFGPHLRQLGRYALHRGYFAKRFPKTSLRLSYLLPTLLVLGIVLGAPVAWFCPVLRPFYWGALAVYGLLTFLSSFTLSAFPVMWILTWLGVVATHFTYGIRFPLGLFSHRMPCEVIAFDHPPENSESAEKEKP